jgi:TetR/AcrR family transcriptional regulator of autoinduction and epiphytic fitness
MTQASPGGSVPGTGGVTVLSLASEQREVAQQRILRAAGAALAARGLAATVEDVAEAAGVSRRTVFRHFATRDALFVEVIRAGVRRYAEQLPAAPAPGGDLSGWLAGLLAVTHRLNARNGRVFWDLVGVRVADLSPDLAAAAAECRDSRNRFAVTVTGFLWKARGGRAAPPPWLTDAVAVQLSGFTTQSLAGDLGRSPDQVAQVSAQVIEAALAAALAGPSPQ